MIRLEELDENIPTPLLRLAEINHHIRWYIRLRWLISFSLVFSWGIIQLGILPRELANLKIPAQCFLTSGILVFLLNIIWRMIARNKKWVLLHQKRILFLVQATCDIFILSGINYCLGGFPNPFLLFFTFHIVLSTMVLRKPYSLMITLIATLAAVLPMWLEYFEMIPVVQVFHIAPKRLLLFQLPWIMVAVSLSVLFSFVSLWFLISESRASINRREQILKAQNEKLVVMDDEKSQLTVRAVHELKAPFAAIKSFLFSLRDGFCGPMSDKALEVINKMIVRCDTLTERICDMVRLSNLRTSHYETDAFTQVDFCAIVNQICNDCAKIGEPRKIVVQREIPDKSLMVTGIQEPLETLAQNLIVNAVNYSHNNSFIRVSLKKEDYHLVFTVQDHGIGIAKENLKKIFEDYFRTNEAVKHNRQGSGLGLAIVNTIVKLHRGEISVQSKLGEGSVFIVKLPLDVHDISLVLSDKLSAF